MITLPTLGGRFSVWRCANMTAEHVVSKAGTAITLRYGRNARLVHRASPISRMAAAGRNTWLARLERVEYLKKEKPILEACRALLAKQVRTLRVPPEAQASWDNKVLGLGLTMRLLDRHCLATGRYDSPFEYYRPKCAYGKLGVASACHLDPAELFDWVLKETNTD
eukprot:Transcript_5845.p3 GENE.Transcript_5845~~Transcript_5845.p3  ORF type:complete len:166 (-),score=45.27 Transcript_5845:352-849(-)